MAKKVAFKNIEEVGVFITNHEKLQPWVVRAREYSVQLRALVDGEGFTTLLINKIEKIESNKIANARKKYSKDIRSLSTRLTNARSNVFQANGGSVELTIESETLRKELNNIFTSFKGQKSVHNYLSENLFQLSDIDPSGLIFIEYTSDKQVLSDIYPTYKSIQDVRYYESDGQAVQVVLFEPTPIPNGVQWRVVDSEREWFINQIGQAFTEDTAKSFDHPFGNVPAVVLSEKIKTGCKSRLSWFDKVIPDMELYAQKSSVKTIYEIQKGLPDHWKMKAKHRDEVGVNRTGRDVDISKSLQGDSISNDVTDITIVPQPRDGDPAIKAYSGYVSPDIDFLDYSAKSIKELEETISETLWGTTKEKDSKGQETATGRYIDQQPIHNALNGLANIAEYVQNALANFVVKAVDRTGSEDNRYIYIAGRRFLIESVDAVLERYQNSMKNGLPSVILDKNLEEWVLTKYKTDPQTQHQMMTKIKLEPYVHWDIVTVGGLFGAGDAYQKVLFNDWWKKEADKTKDYNTLQKEFNLKIKTDDSSSRFVPTIEA
jgi:hypothetical protein